MHHCTLQFFRTISVYSLSLPSHFLVFPFSSLSHSGDFYLVWMALMFLVFIYNAITIPLRAAFELYKVNQSESEGTPYLVATWLLFDHLCDLLYLVDIIVIQSHVSFLSTAGVLNVSCCMLYAINDELLSQA